MAASPESSFFKARAGVDSALTDFTGCTLVLPAVSCGNIGQLAVDLLLCSLVKNKAASGIERVGTILSRFVEPIACRRDYGLKSFGQVATSVEVFRCASSRTVLVHQRAVVSSGCTSAYVAQLARWIASSGFESVVLLGGASASGRDDEQLSGRTQFRYLTGPTPSAMVERLESIGLPRFEGQNSDLHLTGLLKPLIRALDPRGSLLETSHAAEEAADMVDPLAVLTRAGSTTASSGSGGSSSTELSAPHTGIPVVACFLFCMEGINFGQGAQMAQCANALLDLLPVPAGGEGGGGGGASDTSQAAAAAAAAAGEGGEKAPTQQQQQLWHTPPTWTMPLAAADPALF